jgi:hypothetical protein
MSCPNNLKIAAEIGTTRWCVAARSTPRLRVKYDVIITPARWAALKARLQIA